MHPENTEKTLQEPGQRQDYSNSRSVEKEFVAGIVKEIQGQTKHKALGFYITLATAITGIILSGVAIGISCDANKTAHDTYSMEYMSKLPQISGVLSTGTSESGKTDGDSIHVISGGGQLSEFHMIPYTTLILIEDSRAIGATESNDCIHYRTSMYSLYDYYYTYRANWGTSTNITSYGYDYTSDISSTASFWDLLKRVFNFECSPPSDYEKGYYYHSASYESTTNSAQYSLYEPIYMPLRDYFKDGEYNGNTEGLLITKGSKDGNYSKVKAKIDDVNSWCVEHGLQRSYTGTIDLVLQIDYKDFYNVRRYLYLVVDKNGSYEVDPQYLQNNIDRVRKCSILLNDMGLEQDVCKLNTDDLAKWLDMVIDRSNDRWGTQVIQY